MSGQRITMLLIPLVDVTKRALSTSQQHPYGACRDAERRGDLRIRVPGMPQEEAVPLPLRQGSKSPPYFLLLFPAHHHDRGIAAILVPQRRSVQTAGSFEMLPSAPSITPSVEGQVQADPTQPRRHLAVGPLKHCSAVQPQEALLEYILRFLALPQDPIGKAIEVWVELHEHILEPAGRHSLSSSQDIHSLHQSLREMLGEARFMRLHSKKHRTARFSDSQRPRAMHGDDAPGEKNKQKVAGRRVYAGRSHAVSFCSASRTSRRRPC